MSWIPAGSNLYIHDTAPFLLERIDGNWILRDARDKTQAIPFSDIFNNPVFPIDLSNADVIVKTLQSLGSILGASIQSLGAIIGDSLNITNSALAKHFRGESANSPNSPVFSIQGDINTGFYHISDGVFGWSSNGIKHGQFGAGYGGFTGNVIQVVSATKSDTFVSSTASFVDITGLSLSITPKYSNSIILLFSSISDGTNSSSVLNYKFVRNSTDILIGDSAGVRTRSTYARYPGTYTGGNMIVSSMIGQDLPNLITPIVYKIQVLVNAGQTVYINRSDDDTNNIGRSRTVSTITAMEIQQ
jgi:hypothetical protein